VSVIAASARSRRSRRRRASAIVAGLIALAAAMLFAGYSNQHMATALAETIGQSVKSVASMFAARSPGHRPMGKLASLKHKKRPLLHARALPKVRHVIPPLPIVLEAPPMIPPDFGPLPVYQVVAGFPETPIIVGPPSYGPPNLPEIPPPGGGGGFFPPPIITQEVPPPPPPPAVPEPATWVTMLLGFAAIGSFFRRRKTLMAQARSG
jgi:hypothetical protein